MTEDEPVRLLLAEDQVMIREALAALLSFEGDIEVVAQVGRGDEVLKAAEATKPDVAVLDIEMPGMDGLTAAAELKRRSPDTKIVILTTFGRPGFLRRAMESGVSAFLVKDSPADKLTQTMLARKRWKDLKNAGAYDVSRSVLVSTTDVRRSNSAAMYLALTSSALNGDVVTDRETARKVAARLVELFKRQGYQENYVNGNFEDYISQGAGKTPLAWIYENQIVSYALAKKGIGAEMVLMYPQPTITNKVVFVATNDRAKALGALLSNNAELQGIALEYGFRIPDAQRFAEVVKPTGLAIEPRLNNVVDPPAFEIMGEMIDVVSKEMTQ